MIDSVYQISKIFIFIMGVIKTSELIFGAVKEIRNGKA